MNIDKIESNLIAEEFIDKFYWFKNNIKTDEICMNNYFDYKCNFYNKDFCRQCMSVFNHIDFVFKYKDLQVIRICELGSACDKLVYDFKMKQKVLRYHIPCIYYIKYEKDLSKKKPTLLHTDFYNFFDNLMKKTEIFPRKPLIKSRWEELRKAIK